jgi:hypothetical protein
MSQRFEYKFERVKAYKSSFWGGFSDSYQELIVQRAAEGWRFVQVFAPSIGIYGTSPEADLIFERPL